MLQGPCQIVGRRNRVLVGTVHATAWEPYGNARVGGHHPAWVLAVGSGTMVAGSIAGDGTWGDMGGLAIVVDGDSGWTTGSPASSIGGVESRRVGKWQTVLKENNVPGLHYNMPFWVPDPITASFVLVANEKAHSRPVVKLLFKSSFGSTIAHGAPNARRRETSCFSPNSCSYGVRPFSDFDGVLL
jgi:hypothetical protein